MATLATSISITRAPNRLNRAPGPGYHVTYLSLTVGAGIIALMALKARAMNPAGIREPSDVFCRRRCHFYRHAHT